MKSYHNILLPALLIVFSFGIFNSCKKDDDGSSNPSAQGSVMQTTICGRVIDKNNTALSGVSVLAYGQTTTTNQYGTFVFKNINADKNRCVINFSKSGFFNRTHCFNASANTVNYVNIVLVSNSVTQTFSATAATTVTLPDNSSVQFVANSFAIASTGVSYTGTVSISLKHLSPDDVNFGFSIPGGDLMARNASAQIVQLYSYGMLGVELTGSSGEKLQLINGKTATISMPVANIQNATAPNQIPLWYFDETTSIWIEQGQATRIGNNYVGTVSHFSWWNYDYQGPRATIQGKVVDCNGTPVPNINVTVNGWYVMTTDQNGFYSSDVPIGMAFTIQVLASNNPAVLSSQIENIPVLTNGQVFTVADLVIPCPTRIGGVIQNCLGEPVSGIVCISSNNGFNNYQYTISGAFSLIAPSNAVLELNTISSAATNQQIITSLAPPNVLNVGNILLCDTTNSYQNGFVLTGDGYNNRLFVIDTTSTQTSIATNYTLCAVHGTDQQTGISCKFYLSFNPNTTGVFNYNPGTSNNLLIDVNGNVVDSINYQAYYSPSNGILNVLQYDSIGGRIIVHFSGVLGGPSGNSVNVTNGRLNVKRTQ